MIQHGVAVFFDEMEFCFNGISDNGNSMWTLFFVHIVIGLGTELFGQLSW